MRRLLSFLSLLAVAGCSEPAANVFPEARAGSDALVFVGESVTLDGRGSRDPEGESLSFSWRLLSAPPASDLAAGEIGTSDTFAFAPDTAGAFLFSLVVGDGERESAPDIVAVEARDPLRVTAIVPADEEDGVAGRTPVVAFFDAPVRAGTIAAALVVEDVTDPLLPVPFLGTLALDEANTTLVFTPAQDWEDLHTYRATVGTSITGLDGAPLRDGVSSSFIGAAADLTPPRVLAVSPSDGASGEASASVVTWLLSEPVLPATATSAAGLSAGSAVGGSVSVSAGGVRVTFSPANVDDPEPLAPDTLHTATLSTLLTDADGNALEADHVSTFRTAPGADVEPPRVLSVSPIYGASGVLVKLPTIVTFSEPVEPSALGNGAFVLASDGEAVAGSVTMAMGNRAAVFTPGSNLATDSRFDVTLSGFQDLAGNAGSPFASFFRTGSIAPPSVASTAPDFAPIDSTVTVDVIGDDFVPGATVAIAGGGVLVDDVTWLSPQLLQVTLTLSPSAAIGVRSVTVINPDQQQGTGLNVFEVLRPPPAVSSVFPEFASQGETSVVLTVLGESFQPGALASISGAGVTVDSVVFVSESELTVEITISGSAPVGARNATVTNPDSQSGSLSSGFLVRLPLVTSVIENPKQGETRDVTLIGNHLAPTPAVFTTAGTVNSVSFVSDTQLTVNLTIPYSTATGSYDVRVTNPDGTTGKAAVLTVDSAPPPDVVACTPARGAQGETLNVTVTGSEFQPGSSVAILGGDVTVNSTTFTSASSLVANVSIGGGATTTVRDVMVTNPIGDVKTDTGTALFTVTGPAPTVTASNPAAGAQGATLTGVQVLGSSFRTGIDVEYGASITVSDVVFVNSTSLTCTLDIDASADLGFRSVTVTNLDASAATLTEGFQVTAAGGGPSIAALVRGPVAGARSDSASSIRQGESNVLFHVMGSGFQSGAAVTVAGAGVTVSNTTFKSSTRIDVDLSLACGDVVPGPRDVTVTNPLPALGNGLSGTLPGGLTVRNGVVLNEVATQQRTNHGFGGLLNPSLEVVELHNGSSCTFDLTNWRVDFVDSAITGYQIGAGTETYGGPPTTSRTNFLPGGYVLIQQPDSGANSIADNVFISLFTDTGRYIDHVEIGDDEENDGTDGGPAVGNNGANSSAAEEMVGRCPNGADTDIDIPDFFQNELPSTQMAATDATSNNGQCPPCADGEDNDGDGWFDMLDGGCTDPHSDGDETGDPASLCNDDMDNGDGGGIDENDPDCFSGADNNEAS